MADIHKIIGREREQRLMQEYYDSAKAELIAIYGRRRVGKTFLVKQFFNEKFDFFFTGTLGAPRTTQLTLFRQELERHSGQRHPQLKNWFEAMEQLRSYLSSLDKEKLVVFIDEMPWLDTPKSNFLAAFSYFWNMWGSTRKGLKIFVCGSATTWMISKLIGDRGGMHGRVNRQIYLRPFTLGETESFLQNKGFDWNRYQITEAYMTMGGIPYYLDMLESSLSLDENIDTLFFGDGAVLATEFDFIFRSLFNNSSVYRQVVETLSHHSLGMTRSEIQQTLHLPQGGLLTEVLDNLRRCDFVRQYKAFGKKERGQIFQLTDLFTLFHLRFVDQSNSQDDNYWQNMIDNPARNSWQGHAFEQVCLLHVQQIKQKLGITGVLSEVCSWCSQPFVDSDGNKHKGTQIDMVIDRRDKTINLCEMKFTNKKFSLSQDYAQTLTRRRETFRALTATTKSLHTTLITTYGLAGFKHNDAVQRIVTMDDLFA